MAGASVARIPARRRAGVEIDARLLRGDLVGGGRGVRFDEHARAAALRLRVGVGGREVGEPIVTATATSSAVVTSDGRISGFAAAATAMNGGTTIAPHASISAG